METDQKKLDEVPNLAEILPELFREIERQTLERAVEGLTGGFPVTLPEFEEKIREKLGRQTRRTT